MSNHTHIHTYNSDGILEKTGFSYDPEEFQKNGIEYYQFGWEDMTVPSIALMQNIVRIAAAVIYRGGKIAVHCHAVSRNEDSVEASFPCV